MKMNKLFIFVLGAAAGSLVTWKIVEEKYKAIANEEIASVVEQFKNRAELTSDGFTIYGNDVVVAKVNHESVQCADINIKNVEMDKYEKLVQGYKGEDGTVEKEQIKPYVISPEEYGEFENDTVSLTYYSDLHHPK